MSRLAFYLTSDWGLGLPIVLATVVLYGRTMEPSIGGTYDSAELQHAAYTLSLAHATGYPLFLLLGKVWTLLFPFGDIAFRMNWFSVVWAVGTVALTFAILLHLTNHRMASVLGALVLATSKPFWNEAGASQIGTFNTFLTAALILCLLLWREGRIRLELCAFVYGLALSHHRTVLFYAPGVLFFVVLTQPGVLRSGRLILRSLGLMLLPFIAYIYVPLRSATAPGLVTDLSSFISYVLGTSVAGYLRDDGTRVILQRVRQIPDLYRAWFSMVGLILVLVGFWHWAGPWVQKADNWAVKLLLGLTFVLVTLFTVAFGETERYLLVPVMIMAIALGIGVARLARLSHLIDRENHRFPSASLVNNSVLSIALVVLLVRAVLLGFPVADHSQDFAGRNFAREALALPIEPGAIMIAEWEEMNQIRYVQRVEGIRPDIQTVEGLRTSQIAALIQQMITSDKPIYLTPDLKLPTEGHEYLPMGQLSRLIVAPNYDSGIRLPGAY